MSPRRSGQGGWGDWGPGFRPRPRGGYFGRGGVKFAILELLREQPRHGYDIIREIEERSGGVYAPSPGVIYPTLQALEDQDYVKSQEQEGKKVYSITESGLAYLNGHKEQMRERHAQAHGVADEQTPHPGHDSPDDDRGEEARDEWAEHGPYWTRGARGASGSGFGAWFASGEMPGLMKELRWFFSDFATAMQRTVGDPQKLKEIREVLREAKHKIDHIVMR